MVSKIKTVPFRRKRDGKTDYKLRLSILKSKQYRFVVRKSLKHIIIQVIKYEAKGDHVLLTVTSSELKKMGWKHSTSNIPSAYLVGLLTGKKAQEKNIKKGILDLGVNINIKGSRLYAALKGLIDSGIEIPASEKIFPSDDRLKGMHIVEYKKVNIDKDFENMKNKILV
jgi:large subunit ribosomal protein L18